MKIIFKYIILIILIFPIFIKALSYDDAKSIVNTFISRYDDYDRYLLSGKSDFLTKEEYELSKVGKYSYLASGTAFWLIDTKNNKKCILSDSLNCTNPSTANVRVTQNVKPTITVTGSGSQGDPWQFIKIYELYVGTIDSIKGSVTPNGNQLVDSSSNKNYNVTTNPGYEYLGTECNNELTFDKNSTIFEINNINRDTYCNVMFGNKNIIVTLNHNGGSGQNLISKLYYKYKIDWYNDDTYSVKISKIDNLPTKAGYSFEGYYTKDNSGNFVNQIIDKNGNIVSYEGIYDNLNIYAKWTQCSIGYYNDGSNTTCLECPNGYSTETTGSTSINFCRYWNNCATGSNTCKGSYVSCNCSNCYYGSNTCSSGYVYGAWYDSGTDGGNTRPVSEGTSWCYSHTANSTTYYSVYSYYTSGNWFYCYWDVYKRSQTWSSCATGSNTCSYGCSSCWDNCASGSNTCSGGYIYYSS